MNVIQQAKQGLLGSYACVFTMVLICSSCTFSSKNDNKTYEEVIEVSKGIKQSIPKENKQDSIDIIHDKITCFFLQKNVIGLHKYLTFPINIKANLDEDGITLIDNDTSLEVFIEKYLSEDVVCQKKIYNKKYLLDKKKCEKKIIFNEKMIRKGDFLFVKKERWKLTIIYSNVFSNY